jgi:glutamate N-acetyltransferase/amino-acid N-acetyltransferase
VCADLAYAVVEDGEGTNRRAFLHVRGAASDEGATRLARAVAASVLFRAALAGGDPNWGRILAAMGASGVEFDPARVSVTCGGVTVCRFGTATAFDRGQAAVAMSKPEVDIDIDIGYGIGAATYLTTDLTPDYVRFNAEYTT